uniref:Putative secreted protein n=1 Tax=Anopheles triannulatus TaxID=58253 RepID=A0A2M4B5Z0_9DIPT
MVKCALIRCAPPWRSWLRAVMASFARRIAMGKVSATARATAIARKVSGHRCATFPGPVDPSIVDRQQIRTQVPRSDV